jgi:hypothetical protein
VAACPDAGATCDAGPAPLNAGRVDGGQLLYQCVQGTWQTTLVTVPFLDIVASAKCRLTNR